MTTEIHNKGGDNMNNLKWEFGYIQPNGSIIWKNWSSIR